MALSTPMYVQRRASQLSNPLQFGGTCVGVCKCSCSFRVLQRVLLFWPCLMSIRLAVSLTCSCSLLG